jgi:DNA replication initiation complex subunit (GINS family)
VELWGGGCMSESMSYDYLWQIYQKEKQTNQLLLIPRTFYSDSLEFVNTLKTTKDVNLLLVDNTIKVLSDLFEKRKQKIIIYAAYEKQLPQSVANVETDFYNKILLLSKSEKLEISTKPERLEATKQSKANIYTLKSIKDIPEIVLPSGNKIGPLTKNQVIDTENEQDKSYLLENTICEQLLGE